MGSAMGSPGGKDETRMKMSGAIYAKCIRTFNFISCVGPADYTYLRDKWLSERKLLLLLERFSSFVYSIKRNKRMFLSKIP